MRLSDVAIEAALLVLEREHAVRPAPALNEAVVALRETLARRREGYELERAALLGALNGTPLNGYGPLAGPVDTAADASDG